MANCQEISPTNLKQVVKYNISVQEGVHSQTSIDGGKPITQFLYVIAYANSIIIKSGCYFSVPVK